MSWLRDTMCRDRIRVHSCVTQAAVAFSDHIFWLPLRKWLVGFRVFLRQFLKARSSVSGNLPHKRYA